MDITCHTLRMKFLPLSAIQKWIQVAPTEVGKISSTIVAYFNFEICISEDYVDSCGFGATYCHKMIESSKRESARFASISCRIYLKLSTEIELY